MKAWLLHTPGTLDRRPLAVAEIPVPVVGDDELLLRVHACGICRTDLHVVEGELPVQRSLFDRYLSHKKAHNARGNNACGN